MSLEKRFWSKVNVLGKDDCWNWKASSSGILSSSLGRKNPYAKSKYHSVYPNQKRGTWDCRITVDKKRIYLGGFYKEEDAAKAHDDYVLKNNLRGYPLNF